MVSNYQISQIVLIIIHYKLDMSDVVIRKYQNNDAIGINEMFTRFLPYVRDEKFWVWLNRIVGGESIAFVAEFEGKIIGHYAVVPRDLYLNGSLIRAALGIHAFVDPDYRRVVTIFRITQKVYEYAAKLGIQVIYGFPNVNFRNIQIKIEGWKQISLFKSYEFDLKDLKDSITSSEIEYDLVDGIDFHSLYMISQIIGHKSIVCLNCDVRYWLERYILHPQKIYEVYCLKKNSDVIGYFVTKEYVNDSRKLFHLIDYKLISDDNYQYLIQAYIDLGKIKQVEALSVWQGDALFKRIILEKGFVQNGFETFFGIKVLDKTLCNIDDILNINNWRLVMGDSDAF